MKTNPLAVLVTVALVAAVLCTLMVNGGWLVWIPVLLALTLFGTLCEAARR